MLIEMKIFRKTAMPTSIAPEFNSNNVCNILLEYIFSPKKIPIEFGILEIWNGNFIYQFNEYEPEWKMEECNKKKTIMKHSSRLSFEFELNWKTYVGIT